MDRRGGTGSDDHRGGPWSRERADSDAAAGLPAGSRADGPRLVPDGGRAVEGRFETIVDGIEEPVFLKDREGRYRYVNEAGARLFGATREDVVGLTDAELFDAAAAADIRADDEAVMESGESIVVEKRRTYDGDERVFETTKHPYRPDDSVEGVVVVTRDVTDRVQAEHERERNERALRALQRLASDADLSFEAKLDRALEIGRERLDLPAGYLMHIEDGRQTVVAADDETGTLEPGTTVALAEAYCRRTIADDGVLAVEHVGVEWDDDPAYERFGLECYLGAPVSVNGDLYGTLCFADVEPRERTFSDAAEAVIELLVEWVSYELERRERAAELERHETIVRAVHDGVYEVDADGRFRFVNPAMAELTGYDPGDLVGEHLSVVKDDDETAAALDALLSGETDEETVEAPVRRERGRPIACEDHMTALRDADGSVRGVVGVVRDVTEQKAQREMLADLVASSRSFMQARDREEVAGLVADAVADVLGFELNVVRLFDREAERLVPAGTTDAVDDRLSAPTYDLDEGGPGEAFVSGEPVVIADATAVDDEYERDVVGSAIHLPMGVHGTISIGAEERDAFSDVDRRAIELLATSGAAAANRAKREQELREARERAETLVDRINGLIEDTVEVLVGAGTREELEGGVVDRLVAADPYAFAWLARPDVTADRLEATAWAGDCTALADAVDGFSLDLASARQAGDPVALALDKERLWVADLADLPDDGVHGTAAAAGLGSVVAVPLVYRDAGYGVLVVYADPPAIADREQVVLDALGRAVANAVNAIESGRILTAERVIELEFTVRDADLLFGRLSRELGGTLDLMESVHRPDGDLALYVTATGVEAHAAADLDVETDGDGDADVEASSGADTDTDTDSEADADADSDTDSDSDTDAEVSAGAGAVAAALDADPAVTEGAVVADTGDEVLFEAIVTDSLVERLADHGAVTRSVTAEDGRVRFTVEFPYETEAREVFNLVADRYEGTDLVGYHEHERPVETRQAFRETVFDRLTDRQATAVRTAYLGGFFEWPRDVDGDELAGSMDIARPTYHQHLRAAQRKVFEELFDGHGGT